MSRSSFDYAYRCAADVDRYIRDLRAILAEDHTVHCEPQRTISGTGVATRRRTDVELTLIAAGGAGQLAKLQRFQEAHAAAVAAAEACDDIMYVLERRASGDTASTDVENNCVVALYAALGVDASACTWCSAVVPDEASTVVRASHAVLCPRLPARVTYGCGPCAAWYRNHYRDDRAPCPLHGDALGQRAGKVVQP